MPQQPLRRAVTSTVDASGVIVFDFEPTPQSLVYIGTVWVPNSPVTVVWNAFDSPTEADNIVGTWLGKAGAIVQVASRGALRVFASGLTPAMQLTAFWVGISVDESEAPPFFPTTYQGSLASTGGGGGGISSITSPADTINIDATIPSAPTIDTPKLYVAVSQGNLMFLNPLVAFVLDSLAGNGTTHFIVANRSHTGPLMLSSVVGAGGGATKQIMAGGVSGPAIQHSVGSALQTLTLNHLYIIISNAASTEILQLASATGPYVLAAGGSRVFGSADWTPTAVAGADLVLQVGGAKDGEVYSTAGTIPYQITLYLF